MFGGHPPAPWAGHGEQQRVRDEFAQLPAVAHVLEEPSGVPVGLDSHGAAGALGLLAAHHIAPLPHELLDLGPLEALDAHGVGIGQNGVVESGAAGGDHEAALGVALGLGFDPARDLLARFDSRGLVEPVEHDQGPPGLEALPDAFGDGPVAQRRGLLQQGGDRDRGRVVEDRLDVVAEVDQHRQPAPDGAPVLAELECGVAQDGGLARAGRADHDDEAAIGGLQHFEQRLPAVAVGVAVGADESGGDVQFGQPHRVGPAGGEAVELDFGHVLGELGDVEAPLPGEPQQAVRIDLLGRALGPAPPDLFAHQAEEAEEDQEDRRSAQCRDAHRDAVAHLLPEHGDQEDRGPQGQHALGDGFAQPRALRGYWWSRVGVGHGPPVDRPVLHQE